MTKKSIAKTAVPMHLQKQLKILGANIQTARKRRRMTQKELAGRVMCSLPTIGRLEAGEPGVSLSILAQVLWVLGLDGQLAHLAAPESDTVGLQKEMENMPKRIRKTQQDQDKLDF